jgi:hypothetical protein
MPAGNGLGPWGMGPMTGRGAGYCAGYPAPGYMNAGPGRGWGRGGGRGWGGGFGRGRGWGGGFGRGRGWGRGYGYFAGGMPGWQPWPGAPTPTADQELEVLRRQADLLESTLKDIRDRLQELESQATAAKPG